MSDRVTRGGLSVAAELEAFVTDELLPGSGLTPEAFWSGFEHLLDELTPQNRALLAERHRMQHAIDDWHRTADGAAHDPAAYRTFLTELGYLVPAPVDVEVTTTDVDAELSRIAGPQLVVPVTNARFAVNAVNARWGSLYDALYGSDAIAGPRASGGYDPERGARVIDHVRAHLDRCVPLAKGSHADAVGHRIVDGELRIDLADGRTTTPVEPEQFVGHQGSAHRPDAVVLRCHGLHLIIRIDPTHPVGAGDPAGVSDVEVEAAISTIVDLEDSVAAVDAADKVHAYRNWLGLNQGTLSATLTKQGETFERRMHPDRRFVGRGGDDLVLPGRALLLVRNVGHLMTTDAVVHRDHGDVFEGLLDAVITTLAALPGRRSDNPSGNGRTGSVYIVKPKMHGPAEVAFAGRLFAAVEDLLGLPADTIKMGVMDEERRTSANLAAVIAAARSRIVFLNTGFLDRTGDEIHTSRHAGAMVPKAAMKQQRWIAAYEDANVDTALAAGLAGRGQIGKGMWAMPDLMADMLEQKIGHPRAGASTAWVPSPTAATLHALHYHLVDVVARQRELARRPPADLDDLLTIPLAATDALAPAVRRRELDSNVQSILGYVVRWIDQGVGCSKVPDIDDVALMEDRATLRISSQLLANWLLHGVVTTEEVLSSLRRMAVVVDGQNADDPQYRAMSADPDADIAWQAAAELILTGSEQPSGYTEPILHRRRREYKARAAEREGAVTPAR